MWFSSISDRLDFARFDLGSGIRCRRARRRRLWPCRSMVTSRRIITRMTTQSAMFLIELLVHPHPRSGVPIRVSASGAIAGRRKSAALEAQLSTRISPVRLRTHARRPSGPSRKPRAFAARVRGRRAARCASRRAPSRRKRAHALEVRARDVRARSAAPQRLAREAPRQRLGQRAPVLRVDPQPCPLAAETRVGLALDRARDPIRVPALCFGQIRRRPEQPRVEFAREPGSQRARSRLRA